VRFGCVLDGAARGSARGSGCNGGGEGAEYGKVAAIRHALDGAGLFWALAHPAQAEGVLDERHVQQAHGQAAGPVFPA
jgi:hypothetical protein